MWDHPSPTSQPQTDHRRGDGTLRGVVSLHQQATPDFVRCQAYCAVSESIQTLSHRSITRHVIVLRQTKAQTTCHPPWSGHATTPRWHAMRHTITPQITEKVTNCRFGWGSRCVRRSGSHARERTKVTRGQATR